MKQEFSQLEVDSGLLLNITNGAKAMEMRALIVRHLKDNIALITLENGDGQRFNFENVKIDVVYINSEGIPYIWMKCTIVYYQGQYLLQVPNDGGRRYNRRSSFRVGVSQSAKLQVTGQGTFDVMVKDISLTGFAVTDRYKLLDISNGAHVSLRYEDIGHELDLEGSVVRRQEEDDYVIYGCIITKSCRDLASYVNAKQKRHKQSRG